MKSIGKEPVRIKLRMNYKNIDPGSYCNNLVNDIVYDNMYIRNMQTLRKFRCVEETGADMNAVPKTRVITFLQN